MKYVQSESRIQTGLSDTFYSCRGLAERLWKEWSLHLPVSFVAMEKKVQLRSFERLNQSSTANIPHEGLKRTNSTDNWFLIEEPKSDDEEKETLIGMQRRRSLHEHECRRNQKHNPTRNSLPSGIRCSKQGRFRFCKRWSIFELCL